MTRSGSTVSFTCWPGPITRPFFDGKHNEPIAGTVYLILTVTGARLTGNSWLATGWTGTMRLVSEPRTGLFGTGCASSIVSFLLTAVPAPG
jgi:hypothetical protein